MNVVSSFMKSKLSCLQGNKKDLRESFGTKCLHNNYGNVSRKVVSIVVA